MRTPKIERKIEYFPIIGGEIKATNDQKGITEGYLNYIGNIDLGDDRTMPGAFKKTLSDSYARKSQQDLDYLWPYLWNHDYNILPPGGVFEANEDRKGLYIKTQYNMDIQMGRELYASFKMGTMKKQSMGYRAIEVDWVKDEGRSIRNLLEVAVMEGSAVVFPMNDLAQVNTVKNNLWTPRHYWPGFTLEEKAICGNTSGPIGPRDEAWSGSTAEKQIWAAAASADGTVKAATAKKYFMVCDGDGSKKGDFGYPFWYVGDSPHICVGAVKAIAGALGGARGASAPAGLKSKVATLYKRINAKYPDDPQLSLDKAVTMDIWTKDYAESYQQTNQQDWVSDLWNLWYPLRNEIITAFQTGDTPAEDVQKALDQFSAAMLAYVQRGIELDMTEFLQPDDSTNQVPYYMSADDNPETKDAKAGRMLSAANHKALTAAANGIAGHVESIKSVLKQAATMTPAMQQGYPLAMGADDPPQTKQEDDEEEEGEMDEVKMRSKIFDLAALLGVQNADKGI